MQIKHSNSIQSFSKHSTLNGLRSKADSVQKIYARRQHSILFTLLQNKMNGTQKSGAVSESGAQSVTPNPGYQKGTVSKAPSNKGNKTSSGQTTTSNSGNSKGGSKITNKE